MSGGVLARIKSQLRYELAFAFKGKGNFLSPTIDILHKKTTQTRPSSESRRRLKTPQQRLQTPTPPSYA
jgi:hypothetical protein